MQSRRIRIPSLLLALLAALALVAGACTDDGDGDSGGDESSESDSSSESSGSGDGDSGESTDETTPEDEVPTGDFSEQVNAAMSELESAEDACGLYGAVSTLGVSVGNPETKDEVKLAVDFYVAMLNKMADTSSDPAIADTLRTGASDFQAYAESVDYNPEEMDLDGAGPQIENAEEVDAAMNTYAENEFLQCEELAGLIPEGEG